MRTLLYLNGLAILAVVLNHARVWGLIAMLYWTDRYRPVTVPNFDQVGTLSYYGLAVVEGAIQFAIPSFLFVSGFFIAIATGRSKSTVPWSTILSRIRFLLTPYLVWFCIMGVVLWLDGQRFTPIGYLELLVTGAIQGPYYFVPLLIQLYLISPLIAPLAKSNWKLLLTIAALIQLSTQILLYFETVQVVSQFQEFYVLPIWLFITRIFWFILGMVVGFHLETFKVFFENTRLLFLVLIVVTFALSTYERILIAQKTLTIPVETFIGSIYASSFIFLIVGYSIDKPPLMRQVEQIGGRSFGVYLAHSPAQEYAARVIYHVAPWLLGNSSLFVSIIFTIGLVAPLLLMELVRRSPLRRQYQLIFG